MSELPGWGFALTDADGRAERAWYEFWKATARRNKIPVLSSFTVAQLAATPMTAAENPRAVVYVSNETGGATIAFSDGTNWRRAQDRAVVS